MQQHVSARLQRQNLTDFSFLRGEIVRKLGRLRLPDARARGRNETYHRKMRPLLKMSQFRFVGGCLAWQFFRFKFAHYMVASERGLRTRGRGRKREREKERTRTWGGREDEYRKQLAREKFFSRKCSADQGTPLLQIFSPLSYLTSKINSSSLKFRIRSNRPRFSETLDICT